jgi:hypothetical protein
MYLRNIDRLVPEPLPEELLRDFAQADVPDGLAYPDHLVPEPAFEDPQLEVLGEDVLVPEPVIEELGVVRFRLDETRFDEQGRVIVNFDKEPQPGSALSLELKLVDGPMVDLLVDGPMF